MITLSLENQPSFADGSPVSFQIVGRSFKVGRASNVDWILPDPMESLPSPEMRLSRQHFEVLFDAGSYWIRDTSAYGTFIEGRTGRIQGMEQLHNGMRLKVGRYFVSVAIAQPEPVSPPVSRPSAMPPGPHQTHGPSRATGFDNGSGAWNAPPTPSPNTPPSQPIQSPNWGQLGQSPQPAQTPAFGAPGGGNAWSPRLPQNARSTAATGPVAQPIRANGPAPAAAPGQTPYDRPPQPIAEQPPHSPQPANPMVEPAPQAPMAQPASPPGTGAQYGMPQDYGAPQPAPQPNGASAGTSDAFLSGLATGLGVPKDRLGRMNPDELGFAVGTALATCTAEIMRMLEDRGSVKSNVVRVDRTVFGAEDNNPLKFSGDPITAIEALLRDAQGGQAPASQYGDALKDLRVHQAALIGAIQKALLEMFEELSPDSIEESTKSGVGLRLGSGRLWSEYCDRWDELQDRPNGILDAFLERYAKHYLASITGGQRR